MRQGQEQWSGLVWVVGWCETIAGEVKWDRLGRNSGLRRARQGQEKGVCYVGERVGGDKGRRHNKGQVRC